MSSFKPVLNELSGTYQNMAPDAEPVTPRWGAMMAGITFRHYMKAHGIDPTKFEWSDPEYKAIFTEYERWITGQLIKQRLLR